MVAAPSSPTRWCSSGMACQPRPDAPASPAPPANSSRSIRPMLRTTRWWSPLPTPSVPARRQYQWPHPRFRALRAVSLPPRTALDIPWCRGQRRPSTAATRSPVTRSRRVRAGSPVRPRRPHARSRASPTASSTRSPSAPPTVSEPVRPRSPLPQFFPRIDPTARTGSLPLLATMDQRWFSGSPEATVATLRSRTQSRRVRAGSPAPRARPRAVSTVLRTVSATASPSPPSITRGATTRVWVRPSRIWSRRNPRSRFPALRRSPRCPP
ncbi:unannotated protein [freshwater metagenome]|uniref:Unannotated protein n=1 Tax=freshwater metagenome TaxID=449393 RepID=A0A6J5YFS4_9ZZZZ